MNIKNLLNNLRTRKLAFPMMVISVMAFIFVVIVVNRKTITVNVNGQPHRFVTYKSSIGEALKKENIIVDSKDKIQPSLESKLHENETVNIKKAVNVLIEVDGYKSSVKSAEENVIDLLKSEGITLNSEDRVNPDKEAKLTEGIKIEVTRVETKTITENVSVKFKEVVKTNSSLPNTKRQVTREGRDGEKKVTTLLVYENGKEVSRKTVNETITKEPVDRLIVQGSYPSMPVSRGGGIMPYRKVLKVRATAYWAVNGVGKTYTASGKKAVWDPNGYSTIAVDTSVIPFGTKLFVEGYGFAIAADRGTAIKGNKIDVYFNTYKQACNWAVKYVNVYVMN